MRTKLKPGQEAEARVSSSLTSLVDCGIAEHSDHWHVSTRIAVNLCHCLCPSASQCSDCSQQRQGCKGPGPTYAAEDEDAHAALPERRAPEAEVPQWLQHPRHKRLPRRIRLLRAFRGLEAALSRSHPHRRPPPRLALLLHPHRAWQAALAELHSSHGRVRWRQPPGMRPPATQLPAARAERAAHLTINKPSPLTAAALAAASPRRAACLGEGGDDADDPEHQSDELWRALRGGQPANGGPTGRAWTARRAAGGGGGAPGAPGRPGSRGGGAARKEVIWRSPSQHWNNRGKREDRASVIYRLAWGG